jgi:hypothetical protein
MPNDVSYIKWRKLFVLVVGRFYEYEEILGWKSLPKELAV